jgi:hydrogenase nickel incorporation protein HypA/HybF
MHEMSLCEGVLKILQMEAVKQGYNKVKMVWLEIGELSSVELGAMKFSFDVVMKNSLAEGAVLKIITLPGTAWCMQCSKNVLVKQRYAECPDCGSYQLQIVSGDEMRIKELEVE